MEYLVQGESITAVADAIREKGGTTAPLSFPAGMAEAVRNIQSGGGGDIYVGNFLPYPRFVGVVIEPDMVMGAFSAYPQFAGYNILPVIETGTFEVET